MTLCIAQMCKHKTALLTNDVSMLYDKKNQASELEQVSAWVNASTFPKLLIELQEAEEGIVSAKQHLTAVKHKIARQLTQGV